MRKKNKRRIIFAPVLILLLFLLVSIALSPTTTKSNQTRVPQGTLLLRIWVGEINQGKEVEHNYKVVNISDKTKTSGNSAIPLKLDVGSYSLKFEEPNIFCEKITNDIVHIQENDLTEIKCKWNTGILYVEYLDGNCEQIDDIPFKIVSSYGKDYGIKKTGKDIYIEPGDYTLYFNELYPNRQKSVKIESGGMYEVIKEDGRIFIHGSGQAKIRNLETGKSRIIPLGKEVDVLAGRYDIEPVDGYGGELNDIDVNVCETKKIESLGPSCKLLVQSGNQISESERVKINYNGNLFFGNVGTPINLPCNITVDIHVGSLESIDIEITSGIKKLSESDFN